MVETNFLRIFAISSPIDLAIINQYYMQFKQFKGKGLIESISNLFFGDIKKLLITIIYSNINPYGYYETLIHESLYDCPEVDFSK